VRHLIPAAIAVAALTLTACGATTTTLRPRTDAHTQAPVASAPAAPAAPATPAAPACDITGWEAASPGTTAVVNDLAAMSTPLAADDTAAAAADGYQLSQDAIAAETPPAPACAPVLRHAWKMMNLWYSLAGLAVYITGARPGLVNRNYALAGRDVKRALAQWQIVQNQESALGG
jgi:hypothetical protein